MVWGWRNWGLWLGGEGLRLPIGLMGFRIFVAHGILAADIIFLPLAAVIFEFLIKDGAFLAVILVLGVKLGVRLHREGLDLRFHAGDQVGRKREDLGDRFTALEPDPGIFGRHLPVHGEGIRQPPGFDHALQRLDAVLGHIGRPLGDETDLLVGPEHELGVKGNDARSEVGRRHEMFLDVGQLFRGPDLEACLLYTSRCV